MPIPGSEHCLIWPNRPKRLSSKRSICHWAYFIFSMAQDCFQTLQQRGLPLYDLQVVWLQQTCTLRMSADDLWILPWRIGPREHVVHLPSRLVLQADLPTGQYKKTYIYIYIRAHIFINMALALCVRGPQTGFQHFSLSQLRWLIEKATNSLYQRR